MTAVHHSLKEMAMLLVYQDLREREESQVCQARAEEANRYEFFCKNACFLNKFVLYDYCTNQVLTPYIKLRSTQFVLHI